MKAMIFVCMLCCLIISCSDHPTKVYLNDTNADRVVKLTSESNTIGNTEMYFIPNTMQGSAIWIVNGPGANIGMDIRAMSNSSMIYYGDSYISAGGNSAQTGTQIPWGQWIHIRLAVYKSGLSGFIVSFLSALGMDFFDSVESYMIESVYEVDVLLDNSGALKRTAWHELSKAEINQFFPNRK